MSKFNNRETTYHVAQARLDGERVTESVLVIDSYNKSFRYTDRLSEGYVFAERANAVRTASYLNRIMVEANIKNVYYYSVTNDQNKTVAINEKDVPEALKNYFGFEVTPTEPEPEPEEPEKDENKEEEPTE